MPQGRNENLGTTFGGACTVKIWEGKKRPKFDAILNNFRL